MCNQWDFNSFSTQHPSVAMNSVCELYTIFHNFYLNLQTTYCFWLILETHFNSQEFRCFSFSSLLILTPKCVHVFRPDVFENQRKDAVNVAVNPTLNGFMVSYVSKLCSTDSISILQVVSLVRFPTSHHFNQL